MGRTFIRYGLPCGLVAALLLAAAGCRDTRPVERHRPVGRYIPPSPSTPTYCPPVAAVESPLEAVPVWRPVAGRTVVLDAGHGGKDEGTSHFGLREKDINLDLARRTAAELQTRGIRVVMTRTTDVYMPLAERSAVANKHPNAPFVSIHVNASSANPNAAGVETFVLSKDLSDEERGRVMATRYRASDASVANRQALASLAVKSRSDSPALASSLQRQMVGRLGETDRGVKPGNLAVLRETYFGPAVLVEVGFLSHARTAERMRGEDWRRRTAEALCEGICDFLRQPE